MKCLEANYQRYRKSSKGLKGNILDELRHKIPVNIGSSFFCVAMIFTVSCFIHACRHFLMFI